MLRCKYSVRQLPCYLLPPAMKLGQGYVFTGICDSVNRGGRLPQCMLGYTPSRSRHHPPSEQTAPGADTPLGADIPSPRSRHPPGADTPPEQTPPGADTSPWSTPPRSTPPPQADTPPQSMLEDTVNVRAVRILLECSLVFCHAVGSPVITHPSLFEASLTSHLLAMGQP